MAERSADEVKNRQEMMQQSFEISLTESNARMQKIEKDSRSKDQETQLLSERTDKLRLAQTKIQ